MHLKILSYYLTRRKAGHQILGLSLPLHDPEQEFLSDFAPWVPLFCHAISGCHWNLRSEQDCGVWGAEAGWLSDSALRLAETWALSGLQLSCSFGGREESTDTWAAVRNQIISIAHGPFSHQTFTETSCLPGTTRDSIDGLLSVKVDQVDEVSQDRAGHRRQSGAVVRTHSAGPCSNTCDTVDQFWDVGQDLAPLWTSVSQSVTWC